MSDANEGGRRVLLLRAASVVVALATLSLVFRSDRNAIDFPLSEDGYYSLSVARNVALGNGVTIDGESWTNGFQPLFTLLCVPGFLVSGGERVVGVRAVLFLHWIFHVLTACVLGAIAGGCFDGARRRFVSATTTLLYLTSFSAFLNHFNGLETGCILFLHACTWRFFAARPLEGLGRHAALGALLGLCVLGRIDGAFLTVMAAVAVAFFPANSVRERVTRFATVGGAAFLVSLPWWAYNLWLSGSLMPSSGTAQQIPLAELTSELRERRLWFALTEPLELAMPWLNATLIAPVGNALGMKNLATMDPRGGLLQPLIVARAVLALGVLVAAARIVAGLRASRTRAFGAVLALFVALLVAYYAWTSFAVHHYWRYFSTTMLAFTVATGLVVGSLAARWRPAAIVLLVLTILPVPLAVGYAHTDELTQHRYKGRRNSYYSQQVALVERNVPGGDRVASRNSGTFGFFRDGVVNLDGKVNPKALEHEDELWRYLDERDVRWLCDWPDHVTRALGEDPAARGWELVDREGGFYLYRKEP